MKVLDFGLAKAFHEGNHAVRNMLAGARVEDANEVAAGVGAGSSAVLDIQLAPADLQGYVGQYQLGPLSAVGVYLENGQLMMQGGTTPASSLRAQGDHVFVPSGRD